MNPNTNTLQTRVIEKEIEHPVTGEKITRKANLCYPPIPTDDAAAIINYFGGNTERIAKALNLALQAKFSSLYNNRLKGGDAMKGIARVRKGLELAGLDKAAIDAMIQGNTALSASINIGDINDSYTSDEIAQLFDVEAEAAEAAEAAAAETVSA